MVLKYGKLGKNGKLSSNILGDSNDDINFPHKLMNCY